MRQVTVTYKRSNSEGKVIFSTKVSVLQNRNVIFSLTCVPPGTSREVRARFLKDAMEAGINHVTNLQAE